MNRRTYQFHTAYEAQTVHIFMKVNIGASGAPTLPLTATGQSQNKGIKSVVRNSAGNYTINLTDNFTRLIMLDRMNLEAAASAAPGTHVSVDNSASATAPSVTVITDAAGTATDPASGEVLLIHMIMKNSSI